MYTAILLLCQLDTISTSTCLTLNSDTLYDTYVECQEALDYVVNTDYFKINLFVSDDIMLELKETQCVAWMKENGA